MRTLVVIGFCGVHLALPSMTSAADFPIKPQADIQTVVSRWFETARPADVETHFALLGKLEPLARRDFGRFAEQVVYFVYHLPKEEQVRAAYVYRLYLLCEVPPSEIARALGPHLYSENAELRAQVRRLFPFTPGIARRNVCFDYSYLMAIVSEPDMAEKELRDALVRMMFESEPSSAFLSFHADDTETMSRFLRLERRISNALYEKRRIGTPPENVVDNATAEAVRELGGSKYWWARLFASELMLQNKEFRDLDLVRRLAEDENDLVRESAMSFGKEDPLRASKVDR